MSGFHPTYERLFLICWALNEQRVNNENVGQVRPTFSLGKKWATVGLFAGLRAALFFLSTTAVSVTKVGKPKRKKPTGRNPIMRQFQRLVVLVLVVAAFAALLVTPAFAADATPVMPQPTPLPVVGITDINNSQVQITGVEMPSYTDIKVVVEIPGNIYVGCSRYSSADTLACMQRFCSGQSAGEAVQENGVYHCVNQFTPQSAPKRN